VVTKLYGVLALAVGALVLGPVQAQSQTLADWSACMDLWADESICGPEPAPEPAVVVVVSKLMPVNALVVLRRLKTSVHAVGD